MGDIFTKSRMSTVNMLEVVSSKAVRDAAGCQCGGLPSTNFDCTMRTSFSTRGMSSLPWREEACQ